MGNDEDEEAEIPRVRVNPKNPTSREKQDMKIQEMLSTRVFVDNIELNCWSEEERERTTPIEAFDYGFLT